jgi:ubiquinone/menaquinone biosynthesis C-methylase UbiE
MEQSSHFSAIDWGRPGFAQFYDELPLWSAPFALMLLERVPLRAGITVLDVGCGTGFLAVELAQRCGCTSTVVAVDLWGDALERLRAKVDYLGLGNVQVLAGDAANLDLAERSIDLVVSNLGINNFENPRAVLESCHRLLKPGAPLLLTTNLSGHMQEFYDIFRDTLLELSLAGRLAIFDAHVAHRGTVRSIEELLREGGFAINAVATDSFRLRFADGRSFFRHSFVRLAFMEEWRKLVPEDVVTKTFGLLEMKLDALAARRGELALTIPMACIEAQRQR